MGMVTCSECGCSLKAENLVKHLSKVHGKTADEAAAIGAGTHIGDSTSNKPITSKSTGKGLSSGGLSSSGKVQRMSKKERRDLRHRVEEKKVEARKIELLRRKRRNAVFAIFSMLALISVATAYNFGMFELEGGSGGPEKADKIIGDNDIRILTSEVTDEAQFYSYDDDGLELRFIGVRGSDGDEHIAFDACDSCYHEKKGYRQVDDVMKCNNCGQEFAINSLGTENEEGGCWPSFLPMTVEGNEVVVKTEDIREKRYLFE